MSFLPIDWHELIADSEYTALLTIKNVLERSDPEQALRGIEALLVNYVAKIEDEAYAHIKQLLYDVALIQVDEVYATKDRLSMIEQKRIAIDYLRSENVFIDDMFLSDIINNTFVLIANQIELELGLDYTPELPPSTLIWGDS